MIGKTCLFLVVFLVYYKPSHKLAIFGQMHRAGPLPYLNTNCAFSDTGFFHTSIRHQESCKYWWGWHAKFWHRNSKALHNIYIHCSHLRTTTKPQTEQLHPFHNWKPCMPHLPRASLLLGTEKRSIGFYHQQMCMSCQDIRVVSKTIRQKRMTQCR